jgi:hypothetical protein
MLKEDIEKYILPVEKVFTKKRKSEAVSRNSSSIKVLGNSSTPVNAL